MRVLKRTLAKIKDSAFEAFKKALVTLGNALIVAGGVVMSTSLVGVTVDTTGALSLMLLGFVMLWLAELLNKKNNLNENESKSK